MSLLAVSSRLWRFVELLGWVTAAVMVALVITELVGWTGHRYVAALQSLAPYVLGLAFPLAAAAVVTQRWALSAVAGAVAVVLVVMSWPLLHPPAQPAAAEGAAPVRIFHANLLYRNTRFDEMVAAVAAVDADVMAFSEYTLEAAAAFWASPLREEYPYRVEHSEPLAGGSAVWSRYPLTALVPPATESSSILVRVQSPDPIIVSALHPTSPLMSVHDWTTDIREIELTPVLDHDEPAVLIGDFNAAYWHPRFRDLLDRGWTDAHQALGRGFSTSWPNDMRPLPNFVRIDHALVNDHAVATAVEDIDIPGSDHVGLIVTVVPAAS